jgi:phosphotransacetylase
MPIMQKIFDAARARKARVVFPEMDDPRVAEACARLRAEGLCTPVPLAEPSDAHVAALVEARGMKEAIARRMLAKPLFRAAAMVAAGEADAMVAGADSPTRRVIEAAAIGIGLADGVATPSSFFLMIFPDGREMVWADCAVNVDPTAEELADIARASQASALALLGQARVAMLSFSTGTSGAGPSVDKVREAAEATGTCWSFRRWIRATSRTSWRRNWQARRRWGPFCRVSPGPFVTLAAAPPSTTSSRRPR